MTAKANVSPGNADKVGLTTLIAGICFIVAPWLSEAFDPAWVLMLVGFALLLYAVPKLHQIQAPADGKAGEWGSKLVVIGGAIMIALGLIFLVWEAVGTPPDEGGPVDVVWMLGFASFVIGIVAFSIGTVQAKVFPTIAAALLLVGIVGAVLIDMATGAFFEEDSTTTQWGFLVGVPLFGLGLAWIGSSARTGNVSASSARHDESAAESPAP